MGLAEVADITDIADILQTYCRHIADILLQIAAYCGGLRWKIADYNRRCHKGLIYGTIVNIIISS